MTSLALMGSRAMKACANGPEPDLWLLKLCHVCQLWFRECVKRKEGSGSNCLRLEGRTGFLLPWSALAIASKPLLIFGLAGKP